MKKISNTLLDNWEKIPDQKKDNLLGQMQEMRKFIIDLQTEDLTNNPNPVIEDKYKSGKK